MAGDNQHTARLLLFSGFLGSGKTTLVIKFTRFALEREKKVAILVNEIGDVGIDNQLMRQLDMNVWELLSGCVCCTLSSDLLSMLQRLDSEYSPDLVIIEPSGAANLKSVLDALSFYEGIPPGNSRTIAVLDPLRLEMLVEVVTPLITSQIERANLVLITKRDQAKPEEIEYAHQVAGEYNPKAKVISFDKEDSIDNIAQEIAPWMT